MKIHACVLCALLSMGTISLVSAESCCTKDGKAKTSKTAKKMPPVTHTVAEAKKLPDKTKAVIDGVVVETVSEDTYKLKDGNEIIVLEVDDDLITEPIKPGTKVRVKGKVDAKDDSPEEFDVGRIWILEVPKAAEKSAEKAETKE